MKLGRSTGNSKKAEAARIVAAKEGPCMACLVRAMRGEMDWDQIIHGCDYHHTKSGNVRRGHMFGFGLCVWHHRGVRPGHFARFEMLEKYGPSLMDGSRLFREAFGPDDDLITLQSKYIETGYGHLQAA